MACPPSFRGEREKRLRLRPQPLALLNSALLVFACQCVSLVLCLLAPCYCNAFLLLLQILQANQQKQTTCMPWNLKLYLAHRISLWLLLLLWVLFLFFSFLFCCCFFLYLVFCISCQRKSVCHSTGFPFPVASRADSALVRCF